MGRCYGSWGYGTAGPGSNCACQPCRVPRISSPKSIWGNDGTSPASCSQCAISLVAMSYAPTELVPGFSPSTRHARTNPVADGSLPQTDERRGTGAGEQPSIQRTQREG